jgi:hypothetical protein
MTNFTLYQRLLEPSPFPIPLALLHPMVPSLPSALPMFASSPHKAGSLAVQRGGHSNPGYGPGCKETRRPSKLRQDKTNLDEHSREFVQLYIRFVPIAVMRIFLGDATAFLKGLAKHLHLTSISY